MPKQTRKPCRKLDFRSISDLEKDLDDLEKTCQMGTVHKTGDWSPGPICHHVGKFFHFALDGFDGPAPLPVRIIATILFKKKALGPGPMPAGIKLPAKASYMLPDPDISDADGIAFLRDQIARMNNGEQFTHPSPIFGKLTHDQWMTIQLKHAALHLGFLDLGDDK
jgi:Protein of unknown function (DUF1569)